MEEIGKILPKVLQPQLSRLDSPVVEILAPLWNRVAGKALARECRPVAFSAGTLTLAAEDPDWADSLQQLAEEIRAHVNSFLGMPVVKRVRIVSACTRAQKGKLLPPPEDISVLEWKRKSWTRQSPGMGPVPAEVMRRSRVKYISRKGEKGH